VELKLAFGRAVRALREERGLSQERLAEAADVDDTYISGLERGQRNPTLLTVQRVASALGVTLAELMAQVETLES
jgi:XRE family transcriptional regulator, regulator of sulfur utilization